MNDSQSVKNHAGDRDTQTPVRTRVRVTKAPEVRKEELLAAAAAAFAEKGIAATGIGDITTRAQVARGTFYLYFPSKDAVVAELWRRYVEGFMALTNDLLAQSQTMRATDRVVLELVEALARHALANAHLHRLVYSTADAQAIELCKRSDVAILGRLVEALQRHFTHAPGGGEEVEQMAAMIYYGLDGSLHQAIMRDEPIDPVKFLSSVRRFTHAVLRSPRQRDAEPAPR